jgi:hypothetical protein
MERAEAKKAFSAPAEGNNGADDRGDIGGVADFFYFFLWNSHGDGGN